MAAQAAAHTQLAGQTSSMQTTMGNIAQATQMGAQTAMQGVQNATGAAMFGAASAFGSMLGTGQMAGSFFAGPSIMPGDPAGVGMQGVFHGAAVGGASAAGLLGGMVGWDVGSRFAPGMSSIANAWRTGMTGGGAAGIMRGGAAALGTGAAAFGIPLAAAMAVEKVFSIGTEQMNTIRDVNALLSNNMNRIMPFNADMAADPTRVTFRREAQEITSHLGRIQEIGRANVGQFMEMGVGLGLFEGAGGEGGQGLVQRAKDLADAVRDMTRLLGTSMEEGLQIMGELRQTGMDPTRAPGVALGLRGLGRMTGYSAAEMHSVGMAGAAQFRGMGIGPEFGYQAATQNLANVTNLTQTGAMPLWLQASLGGRESAAAAMTGGLQAFAGSDVGRMYALGGGGANFQDVVGAATGQLGGNRAQMAAALGNIGNLQREMGPAAQQAMMGQFLLSAAQSAMGRENFAGLDQAGQINALTTLMSRNPRLAQTLGVRTPDEARQLAIMTMQGGQAFMDQATAMQMEMNQSATQDVLRRTYGVRGFMYRYGQSFTEAGQDIGDAFGSVYTPAANWAQRQYSSASHWVMGTRAVDQGFDVGQLVREIRGRGTADDGMVMLNPNRQAEQIRLGLGRSGVVARERIQNLGTAMMNLRGALATRGSGISAEAEEAISSAIFEESGGARTDYTMLRGIAGTSPVRTGIQRMLATAEEAGLEGRMESIQGFARIVESGADLTMRNYGTQGALRRGMPTLERAIRQFNLGNLRPEQLIAATAHSEAFLRASMQGEVDPAAVTANIFRQYGFDPAANPKMRRLLSSVQMVGAREMPSATDIDSAGEILATGLGMEEGAFDTLSPTGRTAFIQNLGRLRGLAQDLAAGDITQQQAVAEAGEIRAALVSGKVGAGENVPLAPSLIRLARNPGDRFGKSMNTMADAMRTEGELRISASLGRAVAAMDINAMTTEGTEDRAVLTSFKQKLASHTGSPQEFRRFLESPESLEMMSIYGDTVMGATRDPMLRALMKATRVGSEGERGGREITSEEEERAYRAIPHLRGQQVVARDATTRATVDALISTNQSLRDTNQAISNTLQASVSLKDAVAEMRRGGNNTQDIGGQQSIARNE
jgi:hypothetical protein